MKRIVSTAAACAFAAACLLPAGAAASGPAPHGKETVELECGTLGTVTVAVPKPEASHGAGQIVGAKGHGIPVSLTFNVEDTTTKALIASETEHLSGHGHGHSHQATTACTATLLEGPASTFFEGPLPAGVSPADIMRFYLQAQVILKK